MPNTSYERALSSGPGDETAWILVTHAPDANEAGIRLNEMNSEYEVTIKAFRLAGELIQAIFVYSSAGLLGGLGFLYAGDVIMSLVFPAFSIALLVALRRRRRISIDREKQKLKIQSRVFGFDVHSKSILLTRECTFTVRPRRGPDGDSLLDVFLLHGDKKQTFLLSFRADNLREASHKVDEFLMSLRLLVALNINVQKSSDGAEHW